MRNNLLLALFMAVCLASCNTSTSTNGDLNIIDKFNDRWNINESLQHKDDGTIVYHAMMWGGMVAHVDKNGQGTDWSAYDKVVFEFAEPTTVNTQVIIDNKAISFGAIGITSIEAPFSGIDVTNVKEIVLQTSDVTTLNIKRVYLAHDNNPMYSTPIWVGNCSFGNWQNGVEINGDKFDEAVPGDVLELVYTSDTSNSTVNYWQIKTTYMGTETPLEGNANELNAWGCATVSGSSTFHRITLSTTDIDQLKKNGMLIIGYYLILTQCNLLQK